MFKKYKVRRGSNRRKAIHRFRAGTGIVEVIANPRHLSKAQLRDESNRGLNTHLKGSRGSGKVD